jgi:hypothetical protein
MLPINAFQQLFADVTFDEFISSQLPDSYISMHFVVNLTAII